MSTFKTYLATLLFLCSIVYGYGQCDSPDITPPLIFSPPNIVTTTDVGLCSAFVSEDMLSFPVVFDGCGVILITASGIPPGNMFPVGTTSIVWYAYDEAGNSASTASFPQTVTVTDNEAPTLTCPANITINTAPGQCDAFVNIPLVTASDNCSLSAITNSYNSGGANASDTYPIGVTTVTFSVTDSANITVTCAMTITVVNTQSPVITLLGDDPLTMEVCDPYMEAGATAIDACFGDISGDITVDTSSLNTNAVGTYTVTYTVTNGSGIAATPVIRTVNVIDTTAPSLTLIGPNPLNIGNCSTYTELGAIALDGCLGDISGTVVIDNSSVDTNTLGTYTVVYNVTDANGNVANQITRVVNVIDSTPPEITLIGDNPQTIEACTNYIELGALAIDTCSNADVSGLLVIDTSSVDTSTVGAYTVTYNATDADGNVAIEVIRDIIVVDTTNPEIVCPANVTVATDLGSCTAVVNYTSPVVTDSCSGVTVIQTEGLASGSVFPIGTTLNTFVATDDYGNSATCSFEVIVTDTELPIAICTNISISLDPLLGTVSITPSDVDNGSSDNCGFTMSISQTDFNCSHIGDNVITLTLTDAAGNTANCDALVTVTDSSQNATVSISSSENPICPNASVTFTASPLNAGASPSYQWQVNGSDVSGETSETFTTTLLNDADEVTVIMTSNATACATNIVSNTIVMNVNDYNPPAEAGPDITNTICTNTTITLAANPVTNSNATGLWTVTSGQTSGYSFADATSPTTTFTGDVGQVYSLTWTVDNPAPCSDTSDTLIVTLIGCSAIDFDGVDDNITFGNNYDVISDFSLEVWIKSEVNTSAIQTILSKRFANDLIDGYDLRVTNNYVSFHWNDGNALTSTYPLTTNTWHYVAVTYTSNTYTLYVDGIEIISTTGNTPISNTAQCIIGAMDQNATAPFLPLHYFNGAMDELRIWDVALSASQIQKMMNQEIEDSSNDVMGSVIPLAITGLSWTDLNGYYQMNQIVDIASGSLLSNTSNGINGVLRYMTTLQPETAPLPYQSLNDGLWTDTTTWLHGDVQKIPNSIGIDGITPIDWNIVNTSHQISSGDNNITLLGLRIESNTLSIENTNPLDGQSLRITDYLIINGSLDLVGESQLLQDLNSIVDYTGTGNLERDQQGTTNLFNYNYWGSPVSSNGTSYTIQSSLLDGTTVTNPQTINWTNAYNATGSSNPITLSNRWIYTYENFPNGSYADWVFKGSNTSINVGLGFTLKGSGVGDPVSDVQNYVFSGKPNNGTIAIPISATYQALVGNPYPSAIDANRFIIDNGPTGTNAITGPLYFWEHSTTNNSHVLSEYEGGYAIYSLSGGVPAVTAPSEIAGIGTANKIPQQFIPVAQGFFVTADTSNGTVQFNNNQRVFVKESTDDSVFLRTEQASFNMANNIPQQIQRLRLNITLPDEAIRHLLLGFTPNNAATDGIDFGYDAESTEDFPNDAVFMIEDRQFIIQGVGAFDVTKQYPLGLFLSNSGSVQIELTALENFESDIDVYVFDALLNTSTKINNSHFTTVLAANDYINRFYITFQPSETLTTKDDFPEDQSIVSYLNDTDEIYVNIPDMWQITQVHLYNIVGQKVKTWNVTNTPSLTNELRLPVSHISEGTYIVKVETNTTRVINKKVIIVY